MLNILLQVSIRCARRVIHRRRNEDPYRDKSFRMHIEESKDLWLRVPNCVPNGSRPQRRVCRKLDHHLHTKSPLPLCMPFRHAEMLVDRLPNRSNWSIANDGELSSHVHSGHKAVGTLARFVDALIGESKAIYCLAIEERLTNRCTRPDLHEPICHQLRTDPLVELSHRKYKSAILV